MTDQHDYLADERAMRARIAKMQVPALTTPEYMVARKPLKSEWLGKPAVRFEFANTKRDLNLHRKRIVVMFWPEGSCEQNGNYAPGTWEIRMVEGSAWRSPKPFKEHFKGLKDTLEGAQAGLEDVANHFFGRV